MGPVEVDRIRIGTAGWTIPRQFAMGFPTAGHSLERYSSVFDAVEINSTFRRSHKPATLVRWITSTPDNFRFAIKMPKSISHELRLVGAENQIVNFVSETSCFGNKLGPLLLQLPPSLAYERTIVEAFFKLARSHVSHDLVCEPRHPSWFEGEADELLASYAVTRVAADPARAPIAARPGGNPNLVYYRLHGSPRTYYSSYEPENLSRLSREIAEAQAEEVWCIFDNTASGAAAGNAIDIKNRLQVRHGDRI